MSTSATRGSRASLRASARSLGGSLRHEVSIRDGQHVLYTDEPESLGGADSAAAPHELLAAALAACVSTTIVMYARTRGWAVEDVHVDVDYDHRATPRHFAVEIGVTGQLSDEQLDRLALVAEACPVRRAIEAGITFEERIGRRT
jgi:putative redox protein